MKDPKKVNELAIYILSQVMKYSENDRELVIFILDRLSATKTIEKKYTLLEVVLQILPKIPQKEKHFG
jgi:hypothetical protein